MLPWSSTPNTTYMPPSSNPSTAAAGPLGAGGGMLPARLPNQPQSTRLTQGNYKPAVTPVTGQTVSPTPMFSSNTVQPGMGQPLTQTGINQYQNSERGLTPPPSSSPADRAPQVVGFAAAMQNYTEKFDAAAEQFDLTGTVDPKMLPPAVSVQGQQALGYGAEQMQAMGYTFNGQNWVNSGAQQTKPNGQPLTAAQGGNTDFAQTGFAQYNAANNVAFTNQLRWDPERKKYVKIGQLINEGRMTNKSTQLRRSRPGRNAGGGGGGGSQGGGGTTQGQGSGGGSTSGSLGVSTG